ncbi:transposase [Mesorhizobium sp. M1076]|uniref:transposase n=1 Tax=Mesorhizobium sp. M1076 TaxID=2957054 RepID=UPI00333768F5
MMIFIAALRHDRVEAPWLIDGPINAQAFRVDVETELIKTLKAGDNLGSHNDQAVRDIVRAAGARLFFLPPHSPDLNPTEKLFAKLKHCMRRAPNEALRRTQRHRHVRFKMPRAAPRVAKTLQ